MSLHELAGKPAPKEMLVNVPQLVSAYYTRQPDTNEATQRVEFGTSGHRGSSLKKSFNEDHIFATTQAICEYRKGQNITGPLFLGKDTHALSEPAFLTAVEVLVANDVEVVVQEDMGYTPTPVISHAILVHNLASRSSNADGIVITPSHNPPEDGGFKYNPPHGGPAGSEATDWIQNRANALLQEGNMGVKRIRFERASQKGLIHRKDFIREYVEDLKTVVDLDIIQSSGVQLGVDPMGGAAVGYWKPIQERYGINLGILNPHVDPAFAFMTLDKDGKIRMDCSSPYAMASLIELKEKYHVAFGNDPDCDRHGIVTRSQGLMNPNHYLAVAIWFLFQNRPQWKEHASVGKTLVSSSLIDRVAGHLGRKLSEVPVGFKWFVSGLLDGSYGFAGEESAGASFLRKDGTVWTTDKDGIILDLLAAEITARTGKDPGEIYRDIVRDFGEPIYERLDAPATLKQKEVLKNLSKDMIKATILAGDKITAVLTHAPGNGASIGGLKVITDEGWFAARPSGTENVYKIYTESFKGETHLKKIQEEAQGMVSEAFKSAGA